MTALVLVAGVLALVWFSVLIGMSMDTAAQRREWRRVARERRDRWAERQLLLRGCPRLDCPLRRPS
ncbi:hypothetical protein [Pseudonocardia spirodelae]|uniref:Uncharacterized protein n=1 Tax=Pseudonocardia spirodelae TaxID=3133431 RepID=A0ABU8T588_9PSEU